MTEPADEPSLIQQRHALQRKRMAAIGLLAVFALGAAWWLSSGLLDESDDLDALRLVVGVVNALLAVGQALVVRAVVRETRAFEARHAKDAGRQE